MHLTLRFLHASLADLTFHSIASLLITLTVMNKGHYMYLWYIVLVFSGPQVVFDVLNLAMVLCLGRKRRW